jgi:hypothetical protein
VRRNPEAISAKALEILGEQLTVAHLAGNSAPFEFWLRAHSFFRTSKADSPADAAAGQAAEGALRAYKYILAFSAAQPEGLTGTEINWLSEYLANAAKNSSSALAARRRGFGWLWIDPDQDTPPVSISRRDPRRSMA